MKHSLTLATFQRVSLVALGLLLATGTAQAAGNKAAAPASAETLVLVRVLSGPNADQLQGVVEGAVAESFSAVSASSEEEAKLQGGSSAMVTLSREQQYRGYVAGVVKKTPKGFELVLTVYSGANGEPSGETKLTAPTMDALSDKVDKQAGKALSKALKATAVAAPEEKAEPKVEVKLEAEPSAPSEEEEETEGALPSAFDIQLGVGVVNLALSYNQPIADAYGYRLQERPSTPLTVRAIGHWYPGAHFTGDALADFGLAASYYRAIGGSIGVNGTPFDLTFTELNVGLRGRIRFTESELGIVGGMGQTVAEVLGDNDLFDNNTTENDPGLFPDMRYSYFRFGMDGRTPLFGSLSLDGGAHVRLPIVGAAVGELGERRWFPHASAVGFDAQLSLLYGLGGGLSVVVGGDARIYGITTHSAEGDIGSSAIAGGLQDRYLGGFAGIELKL